MEILAVTVSILFLFFAIYGFILVVSGSFYKAKNGEIQDLPRIKVLLPAYRPDHVFLEVLESLEKAIKNHPVDVLILFQRAEYMVIKESIKYGFQTVCKNFDQLDGNSYRHALQYLAKEHLDEYTHKYAVIFDKDNLVDEDFFDNLMTASLNDYHIVQGVRKSLSTKQGIQLFDAISERYNDLMLRKGKTQLGGVLEVSGSAALVRTSLFKYAIRNMDEKAPGYDKNFMVKLLTSPVKLKTKFAENLKVYEEKTAEVSNYQSQRLRWFGEQYFNAFYNFKPLASAAFFRGKFRSLDYWITLIRPPRSIQLVLTFFLMVVDVFDLKIGYLSLPFIINSISFGIVALPLIKGHRLSTVIVGSVKIVLSNMITSVTCLKKRYLNVFIHTR